jgi:hypothetical protein
MKLFIIIGLGAVILNSVIGLSYWVSNFPNGSIAEFSGLIIVSIATFFGLPLWYYFNK